jgi:LCP family protein required for cell wall assembly
MSFTVRRLAEDKKKKRPFPWKRLIDAVFLISGPVIAVTKVVYKEQKKKKEQKERQTKVANFLKRLLVILLTILCAAILFAATAKALIDLKVLNVKSLVSVAATPLPTDAYGHTNILLLGKGDDHHDGIDLTDTIMIASLDPKNTKSAVLLSIPRDLYLLKTQNMGQGKINTMYRDYKNSLIHQGKTKEEASKLAMTEMGQELGKALGIQIHEVIMVDFIGFVQAVDAIGGVDVDVTQNLVDTEYPDTEDSYTTFSIDAGPQHLDGETALKYARSRHSTSDFDRSRRQQQILKAIGDKIKGGGILTKPNQILQLMNIMKDHVDTTLAVRDMLGLASLAEEIDPANLISLQLNDQNGLYGSFINPGGFLYTPPRDQFKGASVLLPVSIPPDPITWKQIDLLVELLVNQRTLYTDRSPIDVLNAGAKPGSGKKISGELSRYDFPIGRVTNADNNEKLNHSTIRASGEEKDKATFLANTFHMTLDLLTPEQSAGIDTSSIMMLLGKDYTYAPLQTFLPLTK